MTSLFDLLSTDGCTPKRVSTTGGGEYSSPCPACGGDDRFRSWPDTGRYWCRGCGLKGDVLQYYRDFRGLSFQDAAAAVGKEPGPFPLTGKRPGGSNGSAASWRPKEAVAPVSAWQERAARLLQSYEENIWLESNRPWVDWLAKRGIKPETIKQFRFGVNSANRFDSYEQWGLPQELKEDGKPKKFFIPKGLVIPLCQGEQVVRLRIRRPKSETQEGKFGKYHVVSGSDTRPMVIGLDRDVQVVVESETDAILLHQEAGDLAGAIALGSSVNRPCQETMAVLNQARLILVALDADLAGAKEVWQWWLKEFPQARRCPPVGGKDPGEMWAAGISLREWLEDDIFSCPASSLQGEAEQLPEPKPAINGGNDLAAALPSPLPGKEENAIDEPNGLPRECWHHVIVERVEANSNGGPYQYPDGHIGNRVFLWLRITSGPDTGKGLVDIIDLPNEAETEQQQLRRLSIAKSLGLISKEDFTGSSPVSINWKSLQGEKCWARSLIDHRGFCIVGEYGQAGKR